MLDHGLSRCTPAHCLLAPSGYALLAKPASAAGVAPATVAPEAHLHLLAASATTTTTTLQLLIRRTELSLAANAANTCQV